MEYFCKYLSIDYLGSAHPHTGTRLPAKTVSLTSMGLRSYLTVAGRDAVMARVASASSCGLTNAEADKGSLLNCLRRRRKLLLESLQLSYGVRQHEEGALSMWAVLVVGVFFLCVV
jgi:hypothetical protein